MSSIFDDIKTGLTQAIEYEQGKIKARATTLEIAALSTFEPREIKSIRLSTGLTQKKFACFIGVSVKTVEAWEAGRHHPDGAACRMLALTNADPAFPRTSGIVSISKGNLPGTSGFFFRRDEKEPAVNRLMRQVQGRDFDRTR